MIETIILAAGQSSRMGSDKALLEIDGSPTIIRMIEKVEYLSDHIYIILGDNLKSVKQVVLEKCKYPERINFIHNQIHLEGMFSSVQKGFESVSGKNPVLLQLIDQPFIPQRIYNELVDNYDTSFLITQPSFVNGKIKRGGHPIIFSPSFKKIVLSYPINSQLKYVINDHAKKRRFIEFNDDSVLHNLNTKKEFNKKLREG